MAKIKEKGLFKRLIKLIQPIPFHTVGGVSMCEYIVGLRFPLLDKHAATTHVMEDTPAVISVGK